MTATEQSVRQFEAMASFTVFTLVLASAIANPPVEENQLGRDIVDASSYTILNEVPSSDSQSSLVIDSSYISDSDIALELSNIYSSLHSNSKTLDESSNEILYKNLWDLYG